MFNDNSITTLIPRCTDMRAIIINISWAIKKTIIMGFVTQPTSSLLTFILPPGGCVVSLRFIVIDLNLKKAWIIRLFYPLMIDYDRSSKKKKNNRYFSFDTFNPRGVD